MKVWVVNYITNNIGRMEVNSVAFDNRSAAEACSEALGKMWSHVSICETTLYKNCYVPNADPETYVVDMLGGAE